MRSDTTTQVHRPISLRGVPPRYEVFDRRKSPPQPVGRAYFDPPRESLVVEVWDDGFREFLKREEPFAGRRFLWVLDVDPDAAHDTRAVVIRPDPMPSPEPHEASGEPLGLDEAVAALADRDFYRVVRTSDPV